MLGHGLTGKPDYDYDMPAYVRHLAGFLDAMGLEKASLRAGLAAADNRLGTTPGVC